MVEIRKEWICKFCKAIVKREERMDHLEKAHNPMELYDYAEVVTDEWEK